MPYLSNTSANPLLLQPTFGGIPAPGVSLEAPVETWGGTAPAFHSL